jgi:pyruvate kinase
VAYKSLPKDVRAGDTLLLNDGQIVLDVTAVSGPRVDCRVVIGGELSDNKGINKQGGGLSAGALTDKDRADIRLAAELGVDYLAVSFARDGGDMDEARELLRREGGYGYLVAKIERSEALVNLDRIIQASDAVMVARGDLGVEVGYAELTGLQKHIIAATRKRNRVVITATQMMESMINNPVPTRAEVSDVANAVMDGTDAVMLSGESAVGKYPVKAVQAMSQVILGAEKYESSHSPVRHRSEAGAFEKTDEAIAMAVMYTANHLKVKAIVALTESGSTPLWMSRIRADIPIYAFTRHEETRRRVMLYRGVYPVTFDITHTNAQLLYADIFKLMLERGMVEAGDRIILTKGELSGVSGKTNAMKILEVRV